MLCHKIDFALIISVDNANPNGDPATGNRPRENFEGYGEISDVCIKRKIRNRLQDMGCEILLKTSERCDDGFANTNKRIKGQSTLEKLKNDAEGYIKEACRMWCDVRFFGQVFPNKSSIAIPIRGPVSIQFARSIAPIAVEERTLVNMAPTLDNYAPYEKTKGSFVKKYTTSGIYVTYGSISCQLAEKTGFSDEDAEILKEALKTLFDNDASSARPAGSMVVEHLFWWEHNSRIGQYPSHKVYRSIQVEPIEEHPYYKLTHTPLEGLTPEIY